jgi:hypothetical protein
MPDIQNPPPASIKVFGILQIVFGGLALLCSLLGALGLAMSFAMGGAAGGGAAAPNLKPQEKEMVEFQQSLPTIQDKQPGGKVVQYAQAGLDLVLSVVMIVSGIGLLQMQAWGRLLAIGYSVVSLLQKVFGIVYAVAFTIPATNQLIETFAPKFPPAQTMASLFRMIAYATPIVMLVIAVYPTLVLIFMLKGSTARALRSDRPADPNFLSHEEDERWGQG